MPIEFVNHFLLPESSRSFFPEDCFSLYLQEQFSETMEMNCLKPKEVFVGNGPLHKNLSQVLHIYHSLRDLNISLRPIFQNFTINDFLF
jgi:hypothetical protein